MKNGTLRQVKVNDRTYKYRVVSELSTEVTMPDGKTITATNWDVKGVREAFYRDEYLNPEIHYNLPKGDEVVEFGIRPADVTRFITDGIERNPDLFDPIEIAEGANA